jgi:glutamate racemase
MGPGVRALLNVTRTGRVGVIGTVGTIMSGAYQRAVAARRFVGATGRPAELTCAACPGLVELVERGDTRSSEARALTARLLEPVRAAAVDSLLLGCTHYPYLARSIGEVMGPDVVLVSSADETAFDVRRILLETGLNRRAQSAGRRRWISSGEPTGFVRLGQQLFGPELDHAEYWEPPVVARAASPQGD